MVSFKRIEVHQVSTDSKIGSPNFVTSGGVSGEKATLTALVQKDLKKATAIDGPPDLTGYQNYDVTPPRELGVGLQLYVKPGSNTAYVRENVLSPTNPITWKQINNFKMPAAFPRVTTSADISNATAGNNTIDPTKLPASSQTPPTADIGMIFPRPSALRSIFENRIRVQAQGGAVAFNQGQQSPPAGFPANVTRIGGRKTFHVGLVTDKSGQTRDLQGFELGGKLYAYAYDKKSRTTTYFDCGMAPVFMQKAPTAAAATAKGASGLAAEKVDAQSQAQGFVDDDGGCLNIDLNDKPITTSDVYLSAQKAVNDAMARLQKDTKSTQPSTLWPIQGANGKSYILIDNHNQVTPPGLQGGNNSYREEFLVVDAQTGQSLTGGTFKNGGIDPTWWNK
jgi:hypothetical protein